MSVSLTSEVYKLPSADEYVRNLDPSRVQMHLKYAEYLASKGDSKASQYFCKLDRKGMSEFYGAFIGEDEVSELSSLASDVITNHQPCVSLCSTSLTPEGSEQFVQSGSKLPAEVIFRLMGDRNVTNTDVAVLLSLYGACDCFGDVADLRVAELLESCRFSSAIKQSERICRSSIELSLRRLERDRYLTKTRGSGYGLYNIRLKHAYLIQGERGEKKRKHENRLHRGYLSMNRPEFDRGTAEHDAFMGLMGKAKVVYLYLLIRPYYERNFSDLNQLAIRLKLHRKTLCRYLDMISEAGLLYISFDKSLNLASESSPVAETSDGSTRKRRRAYSFSKFFAPFESISVDRHTANGIYRYETKNQTSPWFRLVKRFFAAFGVGFAGMFARYSYGLRELVLLIRRIIAEYAGQELKNPVNDHGTLTCSDIWSIICFCFGKSGGIAEPRTIGMVTSMLNSLISA